MSRPVVHFEIGCDNLEKTAEFYREVFGWSIQKDGNSAQIDNVDKGIPGHITELGHEPRNYINVYIETDDIDDDLAKIESSGCKKLIGPIDLPDGRSFAWFEDVAGNRVGLIIKARD